jgi:hypothetical protein
MSPAPFHLKPFYQPQQALVPFLGCVSSVVGTAVRDHDPSEKSVSRYFVFYAAHLTRP